MVVWRLGEILSAIFLFNQGVVVYQGLMGRYSTAASIESEVWNLKIVEQGRSRDRALIDSLFNGDPPWKKGERPETPNTVNTSFLEPSKISHDARRQYSNAFLKPGNFFTVKVDRGPRHKRADYGTIVTEKINRPMKRSLSNRETLRNVFAQLVVHGVGARTWDHPQKWHSTMQAIGDVLIPSRTLLTMENLTKFAVFRRYTAEQLGAMIRGPHIDEGLDVPLVKKCMAWARANPIGQVSTWSDSAYNPERSIEDFKEDGGAYSSDQIPTINCWDFYFLDDAGKDQGWRRRIILDTNENSVTAGSTNIIGGRNQFLYDSGERVFAKELSNIIHFQFADGSATAPFRYHSVRALGLLLYSVCHLQNRLRCRFTEAVFESLMQFYRTASTDEQEWLQKAALLDKGVLAQGVEFVKGGDRWQVQLDLIQTCLQMNRQSMEDNSSSFTQDFDFADNSKRSEAMTATQVNAEVSASSALVGAMLQESYGYEEFKYREDARRFCIKDSTDPDVRTFRVECLKEGVPEEVLDSACWDISAERIIGGGNKKMELAQCGLLMKEYARYGPKQQRIILRKYTLAATDDAALTTELAPVEPDRTTEGRQDAQMATASLMLGLPFDEKSGIDEIGFIEGLLGNMAIIIKQIEAGAGANGQEKAMATQQQIIGLTNVAAHIKKHVAILGQDPEEQSRARQYSDALGNMENLVKGYAQRLQEEMQAAAEKNGHDPEMEAKIKLMVAEGMAQMELKQKQAQLDEQLKVAKFKADEGRKDAMLASDLKRDKLQLSTELSMDAAETRVGIELDRATNDAAIENQKKAAAAKPAEAKPED